MNKIRNLVVILLSMFLLVSCGEKTDNSSDTFFMNLGEEYDVDLNNDKQNETILIDNTRQKVELIINGKSFILDGIDYDLINKKFRLVDLDKKDDYMELAIKEAYPPMEDRVVFFRFDGNDMKELGSVNISYLFDTNEDIIFDGNGHFTLKAASKIMTDGLFEKEYYISEEGLIEEKLSDLYEYLDVITSDVYKEINVYVENNIDSKIISISAGQKIELQGEYNNWLKIKWNNNIYWINGDDLTHYDPEYPDVKFEFDGISFWS